MRGQVFIVLISFHFMSPKPGRQLSLTAELCTEFWVLVLGVEWEYDSVQTFIHQEGSGKVSPAFSSTEHTPWTLGFACVFLSVYSLCEEDVCCKLVVWGWGVWGRGCGDGGGICRFPNDDSCLCESEIAGNPNMRRWERVPDRQQDEFQM